MVTAEVKYGKPEGKIEYPCTMIDRKNGVIVGFQSQGRGTVIAPGETSWRIYESFNGWDMSVFTFFTGSVTLRNS